MTVSDVWTFGPAVDSVTTYADGTAVPHRDQLVYLNGVAVGQLEVHMHRRKGNDGITDVSYGVTAVVFGPAPGGK